jgi:putative oxidoreductase
MPRYRPALAYRAQFPAAIGVQPATTIREQGAVVMKLGITVLRVVVGGFFVGHGLQKLKGWFGGYGLEATGQMFQGLGLRPGKVHATAAGVAETAGGAMIASGFLTPLGAAMITGTMAVAIPKVHLKNGPWVTNQGYEYNAVLMASVFAIAAAGPGPYSLDHVLGTERSGDVVALAQLGAGILGAAATIGIGGRVPDKSAEPSADDEAVREQGEVSEPATA